MRKTQKHQELKAVFWQRVSDNALCPDINDLDDSQIMKFAGDGDRALTLPLKDEGFRAWFLAEDFNKALIESGVELAVRRMIEILQLKGEAVGPRGEATASAQVKAAETLLKLGGYEPVKHKTVEIADKDISKLSEDQLEQYIQQRAEKYAKPKSV